jgi:vacuolar-type H+-ATPase subunit H
MEAMDRIKAAEAEAAGRVKDAGVEAEKRIAEAKRKNAEALKNLKESLKDDEVERIRTAEREADRFREDLKYQAEEEAKRITGFAANKLSAAADFIMERVWDE